MIHHHTIRCTRGAAGYYYASDMVWDAVYRKAVAELKNAMSLACLTGHRAADVLSMHKSDTDGDYLLVKQAMTTHKLRILLRVDGVETSLGRLLEQIAARSEQFSRSSAREASASAPPCSATAWRRPGRRRLRLAIRSSAQSSGTSSSRTPDRRPQPRSTIRRRTGPCRAGDHQKDLRAPQRGGEASKIARASEPSPFLANHQALIMRCENEKGPENSGP